MNAPRVLLVACLALLLALAGIRHVDLCSCEAGDHGVFCAQSAEPEQRSCCAKGKARAAPLEESAPRAATPREGCPGCPAVDVEEELHVVSPGEPEGLWLPHPARARDLLPGPLHPRRVVRRIDRPRHPPGRLRRHLLLSVLLI